MMSMTNQVFNWQTWWISSIETALHSRIGILFSSTILHSFPCFHSFIQVLSSLRYSIHGLFASLSPKFLATEVKSETTFFHPELSCFVEDTTLTINAKTRKANAFSYISRCIVSASQMIKGVIFYEMLKYEKKFWNVFKTNYRFVIPIWYWSLNSYLCWTTSQYNGQKQYFVTTIQFVTHKFLILFKNLKLQIFPTSS